MVWFFERGSERLRYEIRRTADPPAYEVTLTFPDGRTQTERTTEAAALLERCADVARALKQQGWEAR